MSNTIQELEEQLAKAREREAAEKQAAAEAAAAAELEELRKKLLRDEIASEEAAILHLEEKVAARRARIAELSAKL